jgi:phage baseplate assembly protein W
MGNVTDIGWSFPPRFYKPTEETEGGVMMTTGEADIKGSLSVLFSTRLGERLFRPDFGTSLEGYLFKSWDEATSVRVTKMIRSAVNLYEPRIIVRDIHFDGSDMLGGQLRVSLTYSLRENLPQDLSTETFTFEIG